MSNAPLGGNDPNLRIGIDTSELRQSEREIRRAANEIEGLFNRLNRSLASGNIYRKQFEAEFNAWQSAQSRRQSAIRQNFETEFNLSQKQQQQRQQLIQKSFTDEFNAAQRAEASRVALIQRSFTNEMNMRLRLQAQLRAALERDARRDQATYRSPLQQLSSTMGGFAQQSFTRQFNASNPSIRVASGTAMRARDEAQRALEAVNAEFLVMQERFRGLRAEFPKLPVRDIDAMREAFSKAREPITQIQARIRAIRAEIARLKDDPLQVGRVNQLTGELRGLEAQLKSGVLQGVRNLDDGLDRLRQRGTRNLAAIADQLEQLSRALLPVAAGTSAATFFGVQASGRQERIQMRYNNIMPDIGQAEATMSRLAEKARELNAPVLQTLDALLLYTPTIGSNADEMERLLDLTIRLAAIDPGTGDGVRGAAFAINEALSSTFQYAKALKSGDLSDLGGDLLSLTERFGLSRLQLRQAIMDEQGDFVAGLDRYLNKIGATTEATHEFARTFQGAVTMAGGALQDVLATAFEPTREALADIIREFGIFLTQLNQSAPFVARFAGSLITVTAGASALIVSISAIVNGINTMNNAFASMKAAGGLFSVLGIGSISAGPLFLALTGLTAALVALGEVSRQLDENAKKAAEEGLQHVIDRLDEIGVYGSEGNRFARYTNREGVQREASGLVAATVEAVLNQIRDGNTQITRSGSPFGFTNPAAVSVNNTIFQQAQHLVSLLSMLDQEWRNANLPVLLEGLSPDAADQFIESVQNGTLTVNQLIDLLPPEKLLLLSQSVLGTENALTQSLTLLVQTTSDIESDAAARLEQMDRFRQESRQMLNQRRLAQAMLAWRQGEGGWEPPPPIGWNPYAMNFWREGEREGDTYTPMRQAAASAVSLRAQMEAQTTNFYRHQIEFYAGLRERDRSLQGQVTRAITNRIRGEINLINEQAAEIERRRRNQQGYVLQQWREGERQDFSQSATPVQVAWNWLQANTPDQANTLVTGFQNFFSDTFGLIGDLVQTGAQNQKQAARAAITRMNQIQDEVDDFIRNRLREDKAFQKQLDQFDASALEAELDIIEQINDLQNESNEAEIDALNEFYDQEEENLQDHLIAMNRIRREASDDLEDGLASRNMSALYRILRDRDQALSDEEQQYQLQKDRRTEDLEDLIKNLNEQKDERIADYLEQLSELRKNNALRRAEMVQDFYDRRTLEDEDRRIRLEREQRDADLAQQWRDQDQLDQLLDLIAHNGTVRTITQAGFGIIEGLYQQHLNNLAAQVTNTPAPPASLPPSGITPLPQMPGAISGALERTALQSRSGGGTTIIIHNSMPVEMNGLIDNRIVDEFVTRARDEIVPEMTERVERVVQRRNQ